MVRVGVLGKDDELARIIGPIAQRVKVERAPERCGWRLRRKPRSCRWRGSSVPTRAHRCRGTEMRSDPILSVSPSVTDALPEIPAPAAPAATRTRERRGGSTNH